MLHSLKLEHLRELFEKEDITMDVHMDMTSEDLQTIGVALLNKLLFLLLIDQNDPISLHTREVSISMSSSEGVSKRNVTKYMLPCMY